MKFIYVTNEKDKQLLINAGYSLISVIDNKRKYDSDAARKDGSDRGVLYAAGMIAGEGIVGILLAVLAVFGVADKINLSSVYGAAFQSVGNWVGLAAFVVLLAILFYFTRNKKTIEVDAK